MPTERVCLCGHKVSDHVAGFGQCSYPGCGCDKLVTTDKHPYARENAEQTMQSSEWHIFEMLALRAADQARSDHDPDGYDNFRKLAGKAALRASAARQGRVIP